MSHHKESFCVSLDLLLNMTHGKPLDDVVAWVNSSFSDAIMMSELPAFLFHIDEQNRKKAIFFVASWIKCRKEGSTKAAVNRAEFDYLLNKIHTLWRLEQYRRNGYIRTYTHNNTPLFSAMEADFSSITAELSEYYYKIPVPFNLISIKDEFKHHAPLCTLTFVHTSS